MLPTVMKISPSDIILYETCPRKWQVVKERGGKKSQAYADFRFGAALHFGAKKHTTEGEDPVEVFTAYWQRYEKPELPLQYFPGESWEGLLFIGKKFMELFAGQFPGKGIMPILAESKMDIILNDGLVLRIQPDLIGDSDGYVVLDYKTSWDKLSCAWADESDQLTAYALGVQEQFSTSADIKTVICNFVKKTSSVEWIESVRTATDVREYERKIYHTVDAMRGTYHPRRSLHPFNSPCSSCDFAGRC